MHFRIVSYIFAKLFPSNCINLYICRGIYNMHISCVLLKGKCNMHLNFYFIFNHSLFSNSYGIKQSACL